MNPTYLVLLALLVFAGVPYILWTRHDAKKHAKAADIHDDVMAFGDENVPVSIHPEINLDECIGSGACVRACPEQDVLGITDGRARLINPLSCIGHSACMAACPVGAIKLVFGTAARGVELPLLSSDFQTNQPGIFIVGELGGMGLIRNAVEQGRQAGEAIVRGKRRGGPGDLDVIIVGAGPAGISCALTAIANGLRVLVVDQSTFGGTIAHYPRAKVVMTGSFSLAGFGTVRRKTLSKEQLLELWSDIRDRTQLPVKEHVRVEDIKAEGAAWRVSAASWNERAANVVLALGRRGAPRQLGIPGEELGKVHYRLLEPEPFAGSHVMVVGGGNAAADCAIALANAKCCASVSLSYRRAELARLRASVRAELEQCILAGTVKSLLSTEVVSIEPKYVELKTLSGIERLPNDHLIVQIGGTAPSALLKQIGIELVEKRGEA